VLTIAYLANQFPTAVEPYVGEEIQELRQRGVDVISGSVRTTEAEAHGRPEILCLQPLRVLTLLRALRLAARRGGRIAGLIKRIILQGRESPERRLKALVHTCLGVYYAALLKDRGVNHIHAHHGYFGSWIAMVAARLLGVSFSLTLHGSDLLIDGAYLDTKLANCRFCITISEYNRCYILEHFPAIDFGKVIVSRLGVDVPDHVEQARSTHGRHTFTLLAVGRLHAVKDHAFLIRACARLRDRGLDFECVIAGEGPERKRLIALIRQNRLDACVTLLGHVPREQMDSLYRRADVLVLTSRSEGLPLVLMEAMARGRIVLAPAITGIPEIVVAGKTGFLYAPGMLDDFVARVLFLQELMRGEDRNTVSRLDWIRQAARVQVVQNFDRKANLARFGDRFLQGIATDEFAPQDWSAPYEDPVLQQI
jgi:colanic acid/amylovoran biosynthesis glycosyltransferase